MSLAILFASAVLIFSMIYQLYHARKNRELFSEDFIQRLGALTDGQRTDSFPGIYWRPLVLLRWTATMLIMTLLRDNFYLQIFLLLMISSFFQLLIVGSKPMLAKLNNNMLLFNEIMVSIYLYNLLCLTDFNGENNNRDQIAWVLLCLVVITVFVNLIKFLIMCDWCLPFRIIKEKCCKNKRQEVANEVSNKKIDESNDIIEKQGQLENDKLQNQKKTKKKKLLRPSKQLNNHNYDQIYKMQQIIEDLTQQKIYENSQSVASDLDGRFGNDCDDDEEIKQEVKQQVPFPYRKNNDQVLFIESYNVDKLADMEPFSKYQQERKKHEKVQEMMWEMRRLPEQVANENIISVKAKKNQLYNQ